MNRTARVFCNPVQNGFFSLVRLTVAAILLVVVLPSHAATQTDFYTSILRRGISAYEGGRYADATRQLRIAAFGMVELVDQYQLAQIHLALTYNKLGDTERAREAAHKVVLAERVARRYSGLTLSSDARTMFEGAAARLLTPTESAFLFRSDAPATPTVSPPAPVPARSSATTAPGTSPAIQTPVPPANPPSQTKSTIPSPRSTTPEKTAAQSVAPGPQPSKPRTTSTATPSSTRPLATTGQPMRSISQTAASPTAAAGPRPLTPSETSAKMTTAERALSNANLVDARRAYRELLAAPGLEHEVLIRVAEGLYRSRDFSGALSAFTRIGTLRAGEEPYRYYIAVAAYETGDYARARKELSAALPFIEITPHVSQYRTKIENAM